MKIATATALATLPLALVFTGCGNETKTEKEGTEMKLVDSTKETLSKAKETTKDTAADIKQNTTEMWSSFSSYTLEKKEDAVSFLDNQAGKLDEQIDKLKAEAKEAEGDTKLKLQKGIDTLAEKRRDLGLQINKTKNATAETWEAVRNETQEKWNDLTRYLTSLKDQTIS